MKGKVKKRQSGNKGSVSGRIFRQLTLLANTFWSGDYSAGVAGEAGASGAAGVSAGGGVGCSGATGAAGAEDAPGDTLSAGVLSCFFLGLAGDI